MKKMTKFNKKRVTLMLTGTLALTGAISSLPMPMIQNGMATVVYAAEGTEYSTVKGIATMGTGQAHIDISGNDGQTLVGMPKTQKTGNPSIIHSIQPMSRL